VSLTLAQTATAVAVGIQASFQGKGGTAPYTYSVGPGGAGGTINPTTGVYVAPPVIANDYPTLLYDTITVTDSAAATAQAKILVGTPLILFCDVIQKGMGLPDGSVYVWDQKIMQPTTSGLYVAVSVVASKVIANINRPSQDGLLQEQFLSMWDTLEVDLISRSSAARDRRGDLLLAVDSTYARQQQDANSFYIGKLPASGQFQNLSMIDGAAIPYRFKIGLTLSYAYKRTSDSQYFDQFEKATVIT